MTAMADVACPFFVPVVCSLSLVPNVLAVSPTYFSLQSSHVISYTTHTVALSYSYLLDVPAFVLVCSSVCGRLGRRGI